MAKLTKTFIDKVVPPAEGYKIHWDDSLPGYGLRVTAAGKKSFVAQGRVRGKAVCITIGPYGEWTEDEARNGRKDAKGNLVVDGARHFLQAMRDGTDPRDARKQDEAVKVTLRQVADEYTSRPGKLKESSKSEINRHISTTFEAWQHKSIASITEDMCRKRYKEMLTKGLRGKAPAPGQANQGFSVLRALINYAGRRYKKADGTALITNNPVSALKDDWAKLESRDTRIPDKKVGAVWHMLTTSRANAYNRDTLASLDLVMFLILTGARIGEASALTWDRVNLDEAWWHIPDPKNSNPVWLPLSLQAVELLKTRQRVNGSPFVFTSWGKCGHLRDPRDTMKKLSEAAGLHLSAHDLRRSFTTIGIAMCRLDILKVELLTNHKPTSVTAKHYLETKHLEYLLPEVQTIADWITGQGRIAGAITTGANVVALRA